MNERYIIINKIPQITNYVSYIVPTVCQVAQSPPRPITEIKQHWARALLEWVTSFFRRLPHAIG